LLWGAQLNVGSLQPYYPTTRKNLLGFTQEFDNAAWTKSGSTVTANAAVDPQGFMTADRLIPNSGASGFDAVLQGTTITANAVTAVSGYFKADGFSFVSLRNTQSGNGYQATYSLIDGSLVSASALGSGTLVNHAIQNVGNGWYRIFVAGTITAGATAVAWRIQISQANGTAVTGDGTSGIFIWGAQLSDSASLDPYVYNPGAAPAAAAYFGPRFDYDPVTLAPKGLLIEEQRTNSLTFSEQFDNVAWTKSNSTITANAVVSPDSTVDADKLVEDTANSTHTIDQILSFTSGTSYTVSVYVKAAERPTVQLVLVGTAFNESRTWFNLATGVATTTIGAVTSAFVINVGNGWYRVGVTQSAIATSTASLSFRIWNGSTALYTGDGTSGIFLWGAQLESGSFSTSYIPTSTATATRAADVAVMTGANFSNWYLQNEGTFYAEGSSASTSRVLTAIDDGSMNNRYQLVLAASYTPNFAAVSGGVVSADLYTAALTQGLTARLAGAYKVNDFALSALGSAVATDTSGALPVSASVLRFGAWQNGGGYLSGHIRRLAFFPRRLADAELQGVTA
jgi:hypothetical protein